MGRRISGHSRPGFTLVECLAALLVFALVLLLWQPIVQTAQSLRSSDEETTGILAGVREMELLAKDGQVGMKDERTMTITTDEGKTYLATAFSSATSGQLLRISTSAGGFMPIIRRVKKLSVRLVAPGVVEFTLEMASGNQFVGVLSGKVDDVT